MEDEKRNAEAPGCFYCLNVKPLLRKAWSDATKDHFRNARVEFLKGVRSVIDDRISHMARHEAKGTHVPVE
jgi:hypothetical protein